MAKKTAPPNQDPRVPAEVIPIHQTEPVAPAATPEPTPFRWFVPSAPPPYYAHAYNGRVDGATRTVCQGHLVVGGVAPPMAEIPRCPSCVDAVARHERDALAAAATPSTDDPPSGVFSG